MKSLFLLPFIILMSSPAMAQRAQVNDYCEKTKYREVYVPGYYDYRGNYVSGRVQTESYTRPCYNSYSRQVDTYEHPQQERTTCRPTTTILGALIGGGIAAGVSKKSAYGWSIPLGAVGGGLLIGCNN